MRIVIVTKRGAVLTSKEFTEETMSRRQMESVVDFIRRAGNDGFNAILDFDLDSGDHVWVHSSRIDHAVITQPALYQED